MTRRNFIHPDKLEPDQKLQTMDGSEVRIYATDGYGIYPIHGAIKDDGDWCARTWNENGRYGAETGSPLDLTLAPVKHVKWLNIYNITHTAIHNTKDIADFSASDNRIACIRVEYEEGQFDD